MWDNRVSNEVERIVGTGAPDRAVEEEAPPSIVINPHSELGKELRKWEQTYSHLTPPGTRPGNPYVYRPYPKMLYRAETHYQTGQATCMKALPHPYEFSHVGDREQRAMMYDEACRNAENWNKEHQKIVRNEAEHRLAMGQGWCEGPDLALQQFEAEQIAISEAAAQTAFHAQRMSENAKQELKAADAATEHHVVDVQPKKRGRKPKAVIASGPVEA